jgi:hypothetical protein
VVLSQQFFFSSKMMFDDASSFVAMIPNAPSERVGRAAFVQGARRKHRWSPRDENKAFIPGMLQKVNF